MNDNFFKNIFDTQELCHHIFEKNRRDFIVFSELKTRKLTITAADCDFSEHNPPSMRFRTGIFFEMMPFNISLLFLTFHHIRPSGEIHISNYECEGYYYSKYRDKFSCKSCFRNLNYISDRDKLMSFLEENLNKKENRRFNNILNINWDQMFLDCRLEMI